jgi:hypothetical protein
MTSTWRDRPAGLLTRHFFAGLFDFGVLSQEGSDSFVRVLIGVFALLLSLGFLLVRMYLKKYGALFMAATGVPYAQAMLADTTLAIGLPMWIVAFVTVLVSQSLFPDETDFRVLTPLPLARPVVFGAKLAALALFAGLFTVTTHLAVTPLVALISAGRWAVAALPWSLAAFWAAGLGASLFSLLAVVAINGLLIVFLPRGYVHGATSFTRSAMIGGLVLALPVVFALPAQQLRLAAHSPLMLLGPPAWFLGVERVLLGRADVYLTRLADIAAVAFGSVSLVAAGTYAILYRRFDRVMLRSFTVSTRRAGDFTAATLRRSALHQGVLVGVSACAIAVAGNFLLRGGLERETAAGIPFVLIFILGLAARSALVLPVEPRANWIFRMTEHDTSRAGQLRPAERVITRFAVTLPVALTLPLQWFVAGPRALVAAALTAAFGLLWAEILLHDWRRIPFTCSYVPGKTTVAQTVSAGLGILLTFGTIIGAIENTSLRAASPVPGLTTAAVLASAGLLARRRRRALWPDTPLMFTDELPTDVHTFSLRT